MENSFKFVCHSCKYYERYYVKKNSYYMSAGGQCKNDEFNADRKRKPFLLQQACAFWETDEDKTEERMESIKKALCDMADRLNQIVNILKDDE